MPAKYTPLGLLGPRTVPHKCRSRAGRFQIPPPMEAVSFPHTIATFTQWIGGSESKTQFHWSPLSRPIQSCPVVVPK